MARNADLSRQCGTQGAAGPAWSEEPRLANKKSSKRNSDSRNSRRNQLYRCFDRGAGGAGAGPPPARHVYRRHRRGGACTISSPKSSTMRWMRRSPAMPPSSTSARGRRLSHRHRQWARHSGRSASEIPEEIGARSHHDDAACGRQIRFRVLPDLRRPAWRRRLRCQRAVGRARSRSRARPDAVPADLRARPPEPARKARQGAEPARHAVRFKPDEQIFGKGAHFKPARLFNMARAKAYLFGGVEIRWHCAPELLEPNGSVPAEAVFHFPGGLKDYLAQDIEGKDLVTDQIFRGQGRKTRRPWLARMGDRLARRRRWLRPFLLQHHPDARRRHA